MPTILDEPRREGALRATGHLACMGLVGVCAVLAAAPADVGVALLPVVALVPIVAHHTRGPRAAIGWVLVLLLALALVPRLAGSGPAALPATVDATGFWLAAATALLPLAALVGLAPRTGPEARTRTRGERDGECVAPRDRALHRHASEAFFILDRDGRILHASPAGARLTGVSPGERRGNLFVDRGHPDDLAHGANVWRRMLSEPGSTGDLRIRMRDAGGEERMLGVHLENHLEVPSVGGVVAHVRDLTELSQASATYAVLVEQSLQGIAVECDGRIVYANQALADFLGVPLEELLTRYSRQGLESVHPEDRSRVVEAFERAAPNACEFRIRVFDGSHRWIQSRWAPILWDGRPARQIVYADVTAQRELAEAHEREQERLEARIRERTRELEASQARLREQERLAAMGTLAAGVAHQINNPVGAILATADLVLRTRSEPAADDRQIEALQDIRDQAIRCGKIVRSILQFSRAEPTEKWSCSISGVLRTAVDVAERLAHERGAEIDIALDPEVHALTIPMNPLEMEQVFVNLIQNAIQSKPRGARVRLRARLDEDHVEIGVCDDGPGVLEEDRAHVFEPFYTTRLREGGTGLGLSVAHGIVEDHGGRMWLDAGVRDGACFHIRLPLGKAAAALSI